MGQVKATTKQGEKTLGRVYDFIVEYMTANLYAPGVREIGDGVDWLPRQQYIIILEYWQTGD